MFTNSFELKDCGEIRLLTIQDEGLKDWDLSGATHVRLSLPSGQLVQNELIAQGFVFGDRTLDVEIRPHRTKLDYTRLVRITPEVVYDCRQEILDIALAGFTFDSRFHVTPDHDARVAAIIIKTWVHSLDEVLICRLKGKVVGFLALKELDGKEVSVHLAAVSEKYRTAGVALSLYAGAVCCAQEKGFETIKGRISSLNMSVMNLYAFLGASFFNPMDVYFKVM